MVPGHELAGVALDGPYAGRRVAVDPAIPCGRCELCREGHGNLCPDVGFAGHGTLDGGLQERLVWPDDLLFPLPDELSDDAGALLEPLGVAIHAVGTRTCGAATTCSSSGPDRSACSSPRSPAGPAPRGCFVSEPLEHRRRTALRFGADAAWSPEEAEERARCEATGGRGVDVVVEMAGADDAHRHRRRLRPPRARIALGGIPSTPQSAFPAAPRDARG